MNYELAKELKDAGYPLKKGTRETWSGDQSIFFLDGETIAGHKVHYIRPTLEELIEACGDKFGGVIRGGKQKSDGARFTAFEDAMEVLQDDSIADEDEVPHGEGATPAEAVAKLWLTLNKKI